MPDSLPQNLAPPSLAKAFRSPSQSTCAVKIVPCCCAANLRMRVPYVRLNSYEAKLRMGLSGCTSKAWYALQA